MDFFDDSCHRQQYFDSEGMDMRKDKRKLLAAASRITE